MPTTPRPTRRRRALVAVAAAVASLATVIPVVTAPPAGAAVITHADFAGRGYGHGRGMSQYGAFGYARDFGWSTDQILAHYYGGTRPGSVTTTGGIPIADANRLRIRLMGLDNEPGTLVGGGSDSTLSIVETGNPTIPPTAKAVRMVRTGDRWMIATAESCDGPWTDLGESAGPTVTIRDTPGTDGLFVCRPSGVKSFYAGWLRAQITDVGTRTINVTSIEEYLRGVVPREMPATWHAAALRVQAVAARSYAMAGDTRHKDTAGVLYADTCDTTLCQVYKGRFEQAPGQAKVATTHPATDAAIAATGGVVREFVSNGNIARTEFSSTSGGWTAGGTFPAVEDKGDVISPVHTWNASSVSLAPLASLGTGNLVGITVTQRNGLGADGGRVLQVRLDFDGRDTPVYVSGDVIRSRLGLRSNWYTISDVPPPPPPSGYSDVPEGSIYEDAVAWADETGITKGCTPTTFCPTAPVTRAQTATFLWRHQGEPTSTGPQFDDVEDGTYYFDAVRWVRDQGITEGCSETRFCPNGNATRAQLVTFLWRHAREPVVSGDHGFTDVPPGSYYEMAVKWAVREGITTGTSATTFSPNDSVTRGQTVLFLYRYLS
jgi:peptidoglycan hydrolase-like amidase